MSDLSHFDEHGAARMVDVGDKGETDREATASGAVEMEAATLARIVEGGIAKGDVLGVARIAALSGVKRTAELIPLCHALPLTSVDVEFAPEPAAASGRAGLRVTTTASADARTGVEMEALTAAAIAGLTVYDMCKAVDRGMTVTGVALLRKQGGASGTWAREEPSR